jgi:siroheme synthase (precorrin-2 oxidase/ferrochelatase)
METIPSEPPVEKRHEVVNKQEAAHGERRERVKEALASSKARRRWWEKRKSLGLER